MVKRAVNIAVLYTLFASFSTVVNISFQMLSIWAFTGSYVVELSILIGTIAGILPRYFLDKRYIFEFKSKNITNDSKLFVNYSAMGLITTVIFWGTEYAFHHIYETEFMRYLGGVIGLAVGFYIKYQLDKKYVFVNGNTRILL